MCFIHVLAFKLCINGQGSDRLDFEPAHKDLQIKSKHFILHEKVLVLNNVVGTWHVFTFLLQSPLVSATI